MILSFAPTLVDQKFLVDQCGGEAFLFSTVGSVGGPILAPFPNASVLDTLAQLVRQRNKHASVWVTYSGSLSNASVPDTPAQSIRQRNENASVWVTHSGSLSQRQRP